MDIEVNYKNKKRYKTAKYPIRQPKILTALIWVLSRFALIGKKYKVEKINMEGLKPPFIMLSNHRYGGSEASVYAAEQPYVFHRL